MSTTRLLIIVLILLNALAFAGVKGWIVGTPPRTEPERITNQLNPERIRLSGVAVAETPAEAESMARTGQAEEPVPLPDADEVATAGETLPSPQPPALLCQAWAGLNDQEADALTRRLRQAGVEAERRRSETPSAWWVRVPPQGSRDQAERRVQELRELGVKDMFIVHEAGQSQYAISLGLFKTEARAQQLLGQLRARGVRNAGVEARMSTTYLIQARLADEGVRAIEADVRGISARRTACNGR